MFSPAFPLFRGSRRLWHIAYGSYQRRFLRGEIADLFGRDFEILRLTEERGEGAGFWRALMRVRSERR